MDKSVNFRIFYDLKCSNFESAEDFTDIGKQRVNFGQKHKSSDLKRWETPRVSVNAAIYEEEAALVFIFLINNNY